MEPGVLPSLGRGSRGQEPQGWGWARPCLGSPAQGLYQLGLSTEETEAQRGQGVARGRPARGTEGMQPPVRGRARARGLLALHPRAQLTLMRSMPASMRSCSTSFRAWATLLVADIVCHQRRPRCPESCRGGEQTDVSWLVKPRPRGQRTPPPRSLHLSPRAHVPGVGGGGRPSRGVSRVPRARGGRCSPGVTTKPFGAVGQTTALTRG